MRIESTVQPSTIIPKDVPVVVLALTRPSPHPRTSGSGPNDAVGGPAVVDRAFVPLPDTWMELRARVCVTFGLPLHIGLWFKTDTLNVCRGDPIRITEDAYAVMKDMLDVIRVEVVPLTGYVMREEKEEQEKEKGWGMLRAEVEETDEDQEEEEEEERAELEYVDVPAADNGRKRHPEPPLSVMSSNARARKQSQGTHVLSAQSVTAKPRASAPATKSASARSSPVPPPQDPSPVIVPSTAPLAADPPKDLRFKIYISGPAGAHHAEFMTRGAHPVRKVLSAACNTFGVEYSTARLMLTNPHDDPAEEEETLCPTQMTMGDCGVAAGSRLVVRCHGE